MRKCAKCRASWCRGGQERGPPDTRGGAYRESNGADLGGQPSAALQGLVYHSDTCNTYNTGNTCNAGNTCLIRPAIPFTDWQLSSHQACAECMLPLDIYSHHNCGG
jgi:hypothetical protein